MRSKRITATTMIMVHFLSLFGSGVIGGVVVGLAVVCVVGLWVVVV
jgi:hypothetical protein